MTIGQILLRILGQYVMFCYYFKRWILVLVFLGVLLFLVAVELAVRAIQAYVFCSLLRIYSNEHSV